MANRAIQLIVYEKLVDILTFDSMSEQFADHLISGPIRSMICYYKCKDWQRDAG